MKALHEIASLVRKLTEEVSIDVRDYCFADHFPSGCCQDTSRVLGKLLQNLGFDGFILVVGRRELIIDTATGRGSQPTHVWLEREGVIVDITADQFAEEISHSVLVTADHSWHDTWQEQQKYDLDELSGKLELALYKAIADHPNWRNRSQALLKP